LEVIAARRLDLLNGGIKPRHKLLGLSHGSPFKSQHRGNS
jgi:hypothetical protein